MKYFTDYKAYVFAFLLFGFFGCDNNININESHNSNSIHGSGRIVSQTRSVKECSGIKITNVGDVFLTQGQEQVIRIEADDNIIKHVIAEERNGTLNVGLENGSYSDITLKIFVSLKTIKNLSIEGAGSISTQNFQSCSDLKCDIIGAGKIYLNGKGENFYCSITGTGKITAEDFKVKKCTATVNGAGNCMVYSSDEINATVSGVGSIIYYGNPGIVKTNVLGLGQIICR